MQYLKCTASIPGLLENTVLEFNGNPIIIYGKNGSGKTVIAKSLLDVIFKKFTVKSVVPDDFWESIYLDLQFSISNNGSYRVVNNGNRYYTILHFNGGTETILYSDSAASADDDQENNTRLEDTEAGVRLLRFIDSMGEQLFLFSTYVPSPADLKAAEHVDYQLLQYLMINDRSLRCDLNSDLTASGGTRFPLKRLDEEILRQETHHRDLEKKIQLIDVSKNRLDKLYREKKNILREMRDINNTLSTLTKQEAVLHRIVEDLKRIDECNIELEELRGTVIEEEEKTRLVGDIRAEIDTRFPHFKQIEIDDIPSLDELQRIFNKIKNVNEETDTLRFKNRQRKKRIIMLISGIGIAALIALAAVFIENKFSLEGRLDLLLGIAVSSIIISSALALYLAATKGKKHLETLRQERAELEGSIKEKIKGNRVDYDGEKVHELYDFLLQYFEDYLEFSEKTREYYRIKSSIKDRETMGEITNRLVSLKKEEGEIKESIESSINALEVVKSVEINTAEIENLIHTIGMEMDNCRQRIGDKEKILSQIDTEIEDHPDSKVELKTLIDERDVLRARIKVLHGRRRAAKFIQDSLADAEHRREQRQLKRLVKNTVEKFNYLTGNQYITKIDERTVQDFLHNGSVPPDLNPAVVHGIILSIKFSLTELFAGRDDVLPLILDDPFYNMDEERMRRFKDMLDETARSRQVILFTHQRDTRNWGKYLEL
ncbi:MAG: hypothetical protein JXA20_16955 [Spirochaetes bacterium]|nr:hypothetical protein [Spirochaetota bacterium]